MAVYPSGQPVPHIVTTLVMPSTTSLDETAAASLPATSDGDNVMYRVRKLSSSALDDVSTVTVKH